jgi:CheY-like chemotaxis protein
MRLRPSHTSMNAQILALLEDSKNMQQVSECLEQSGHSVLRADRFEQAMEILERHHVDLIVSDVHLQNGGDIFDFLVRLHSNPPLREIPFVCFSFQPSELADYLAEGVQTAARMLGAASYISMKIFDGAAFCHKIDAVLAKNGAPMCLVAPRPENHLTI